MGLVETRYDKIGNDEALRSDIRNLRNAINAKINLLELDARTSDPTGLPTTTSKVYLWYRTDTNKLSAYVNGSVKTVTLT